MQSEQCKQERQSQVNPPCIGSATTTSERVEYRLGGRLVEIHTYSTSTYHEVENSSQFFWLAEWFVQSANTLGMEPTLVELPSWTEFLSTWLTKRYRLTRLVESIFVLVVTFSTVVRNLTDSPPSGYHTRNLM